ncbi:DUF2252 family protein [Pseudogracilibacillus auburnensis]|uniref:DUF2252 family protein n=1 Tax=Pseudogracilibacillus auburnensis TaxID=1494959 RepID=UPI001A96DE90|nr:DUF2252 family protein [Pseudogracilibacillus auburnensis]MBO1002470.1 DUF2252 family protein [Pseudogracilibacillus auburnensis]
MQRLLYIFISSTLLFSIYVPTPKTYAEELLEIENEEESLEKEISKKVEEAVETPESISEQKEAVDKDVISEPEMTDDIVEDEENNEATSEQTEVKDGIEKEETKEVKVEEEQSTEVVIEDKALHQAIQQELEKLGHTEMTHETLAEIKKLEKIRDKGIKSIEGIQYLVNLEKLELRSNEIADLTPLKTLKQLQSIDLRENNISSLAGIADLHKLKSLDVRSNYIESLEPIRNLTNLESIDIRNNQVTNIEAVQQLTSLKKFSARNNGINDLSPLANLVELQELNLHSNQVVDLSPISNLTKLKELVLRRNQIVDITPLQHLLALKDVNLRDNDIADLGPLSEHQHLTVRLHLDGNSRLVDFSAIAHYYDEIEDVDFVLPGRTTIDVTKFNPSSGEERNNDLIKNIIAFNEHISDASMKDTKLTQMASSPFSFYRGTAALFFVDVKNNVIEIPSNWYKIENPNTWITGDLHIENVGFYGNKHKEAVFDLNDFDEVGIAPFYYDLLNFATSIYLLNDVAPKLQLEETEIVNMTEAYATYYREAIQRVADGSIDVDNHSFTKDNMDGFVGNIAKDVSKEPLNKELLTWTTIGETREFDLTNNRLEKATDEEKEEIVSNWDSYIDKLDPTIIQQYGKSYFTVKDIARRVNAGLGSLGYDRYYILIEGETTSDDDDIILDVKAQGRSAVEALGGFDGSQYGPNATRTITGAFALHNDADIHWGTLETKKQSYLVKERSPFKEEVKPVDFEGAADLEDFIKISAEVTAYAHARAANSLGNDTFASKLSAAFNNDLSDFDKELAELALAYYAQVVHDHSLYSNLYENNVFDQIDNEEDPDEHDPTDKDHEESPDGENNNEEVDEPTDENSPNDKETNEEDLDGENGQENNEKIEQPVDESNNNNGTVNGEKSTKNEEQITKKEELKTDEVAGVTVRTTGEKGENPIQQSNDSGLTEGKLPQTATNYFNNLFAGSLIFLLGVIALLFLRKEKLKS